VEYTAEVERALEFGAALIASISGGKDSQARQVGVSEEGCAYFAASSSRGALS
jgi:hypothetical protein